MKANQLNELILQSLEHEKRGVKIYETALKYVINPDLREDWEEYLEQTRNHVKVLTTLCTNMSLESEQDTSGQQVGRSARGKNDTSSVAARKGMAGDINQ